MESKDTSISTCFVVDYEADLQCYVPPIAHLLYFLDLAPEARPRKAIALGRVQISGERYIEEGLLYIA